MIILQIEVTDFSALESKGDPPITRYRQAPGSGPVAGQLVDVPTGRTLNAINVRCGNQSRQYAAHPVHEVAADFVIVVIFNEAF